MGEALGDLLAHLGESHLDGLDQARLHLETAQRRLVTAILGPPPPTELTPIVWLNTYVELDETLEPLFQKIGALPEGAPRISALFLSAPTAIAEADQASVTEAHTQLWNALGAGVGTLPEWSLTSQLHLCQAHPGQISFKREGGSLVPETPNVILSTDDSNYKREYTALLAQYPGSRYIHLSLPAAAKMRPMIGPAGAYLLVRDGSGIGALPQCLWLHVRSFLQALVAAYVWSVGEHLRWSIVEAVETFALNQLTFAKFSETAERLRDMVDPVYVDTQPFAAACRAAAKLFASSAAHTVQQWTDKGENEKMAGLKTLVTDLRRIAAGSRSELAATSLVEAIASAISTLLADSPPQYEGAIRHAKALDHDSICLSLLNPDYSAATIAPFGLRNGANLVHLHEAIVQLWDRRALLSFNSDNGCEYLVLTLTDRAAPVVATALKILNKEDVGSLKDMTRSVAALVRGLFNAKSRTEDDKSIWRDALTTEASTTIRFQIESTKEP